MTDSENQQRPWQEMKVLAGFEALDDINEKWRTFLGARAADTLKISDSWIYSYSELKSGVGDEELRRAFSQSLSEISNGERSGRFFETIKVPVPYNAIITFYPGTEIVRKIVINQDNSRIPKTIYQKAEFVFEFDVRGIVQTISKNEKTHTGTEEFHELHKILCDETGTPVISMVSEFDAATTIWLWNQIDTTTVWPEGTLLGNLRLDGETLISDWVAGFFKEGQDIITMMTFTHNDWTIISADGQTQGNLRDIVYFELRSPLAHTGSPPHEICALDRKEALGMIVEHAGPLLAKKLGLKGQGHLLAQVIRGVEAKGRGGPPPAVS